MFAELTPEETEGIRLMMSDYKMTRHGGTVTLQFKWPKDEAAPALLDKLEAKLYAEEVFVLQLPNMPECDTRVDAVSRGVDASRGVWVASVKLDLITPLRDAR